MSTLNMPTVSITFRQAAADAIARSQKGTVALIIRDAIALSEEKHYTLASARQIPSTLGAANQAEVKRVFLGYVNPPMRVILCVIAADAVIAAASDCLVWLATQSFDYLAGPSDLTAAEAMVIKTWIAGQRSDNHAIYKAVLPDTAADSEAIINFTTAGIKVGSDTFAAAAYCGRIAGLIAGTPRDISAAYAPLSEVEDVTRLSKTDMDTAVGAGKLLAFWDGEKIKLGRAVNSLTTITNKSDDWKYIKIVETLDMLDHDIRKAAEDGFIGKYANTYANKQLLVAAIRDYLQGVADADLIGQGFTCVIDVDAQETYLQGKGVDTSAMTEQGIREADTGTNVFLALSVKPVNAIEDITIQITL